MKRTYFEFQFHMILMFKIESMIFTRLTKKLNVITYPIVIIKPKDEPQDQYSFK